MGIFFRDPAQFFSKSFEGEKNQIKSFSTGVILAAVSVGAVFGSRIIRSQAKFFRVRLLLRLLYAEYNTYIYIYTRGEEK